MANRQKGKNLEDIQQMNRALVIQMLQDQGQTSRAEIAKMSGLNQATITNIINDFLDWGLVREVGMISGSKGRRSIAIELAAERFKTISIRITRKYYLIGIFDLNGTCYGKKSVAIELHQEPKKTIERIRQEVISIKEQHKEDRLLGVGIALPGPFIKKRGKIALLTETSGWQDIDTKELLEEDIGLKVYLEHDANAAALAEWKSYKNMSIDQPILCIMMGQGIGAGYIEDGKILRGNIGIAGEVGHMSIQCDGEECECGNKGCLETYSSTISILKRMKAELGQNWNSRLDEQSKIQDVLDAYGESDELACHLIKRAAKYLGYGIANLINILNPGLIIIGDELSQAGHSFLEEVQGTVKSRVLPSLFETTEIVLSELEEDAALLGVAILVDEESINKSKVFQQERQADGE